MTSRASSLPTPHAAQQQKVYNDRKSHRTTKPRLDPPYVILPPSPGRASHSGNSMSSLYPMRGRTSLSAKPPTYIVGVTSSLSRCHRRRDLGNSSSGMGGPRPRSDNDRYQHHPMRIDYLNSFLTSPRVKLEDLLCQGSPGYDGN